MNVEKDFEKFDADDTNGGRQQQMDATDMITDQMLKSSDIPVEVEFQARLDRNVKQAGYTGPERVFGADLIATLFGILVEALKGCLGQQSQEKIVRKMRKPSVMQRAEIRSRIASRVFKGTKNYERMGGQQVYAGLFGAIDESSDDDLKELVQYTYVERLPDPPNEGVDFGRLV